MQTGRIQDVNTAPPDFDSLCFLLAGRRLGLRSLLPAAANHHNSEEGSDNCRAQESENDGNSNSPDAGREEVMERMSLIDEGLEVNQLVSCRL
jgi:hypothetical protein